MSRKLTAALIAVFLVAFAAPAVSAAPVDGSSCVVQQRYIDVSSWQGGIDWPQVPSSGISGAWLKATEGTGYTDPTFTRNRAGAEHAGIPWGGYSFGRPSTDPVASADRFIDAGGADGTLLPVLDLETTDGRGPDAVGQWAAAFMDRVTARTGRPVVIYVGAYFSVNYDYLTGHRLWLPSYMAGYQTDPNPCFLGQPRVPDGFGGWDAWQYTSSSSVNGIDGSVDQSVVTPEFAAYMTGTGSAPAPVIAPVTAAPWTVYRQGSVGPGVAQIQQIVGATPDGHYGPATVAAVKVWQRAHGLAADGVWGVDTQRAADAEAVAAYLDDLNSHAVAAYLYTLSAQRHRVAAYLYTLDGKPVPAYLHTVAADREEVLAYLNGVYVAANTQES